MKIVRGQTDKCRNISKELVISKPSDEEMGQLLTEVVAFHLRSPIIKYLPTLEEKARKIESICFDGGGTDTCNLISHYDDLYTAILDHLQHLSANNTTQHKGNNDANL